MRRSARGCGINIFSNNPSLETRWEEAQWAGEGEKLHAALCGLDQGESNTRLLDSNTEGAAGLSVEREGKEASGASPVFGA